MYVYKGERRWCREVKKGNRALLCLFVGSKISKVSAGKLVRRPLEDRVTLVALLKNVELTVRQWT